MFNLRVTTDLQPLTSSGQPHQSTTGAARANSTQARIAAGSQCTPTMCIIAISTSGPDRTTLTQKRRVMSFNSWSSSWPSSDTVSGSNAMPQMGQLPGPSRTISACIGQVYCVLGLPVGGGLTGSKAMPHLGQAPGPSWRTSGCIGHV